MQVLQRSCSVCNWAKDKTTEIEGVARDQQPLKDQVGVPLELTDSSLTGRPRERRRVNISLDDDADMPRVPSTGSDQAPGRQISGSEASVQESNLASREPDGSVSQETPSLTKTRENLGQNYDVEFLNALLDLLWPLISKAAAKFVQTRMTPMLQSELPAILQNTTFSKLDFGRRAPHVTSLKLYRQAKLAGGSRSQPALEVAIIFSYHADSSSCIELSVAGRHRADVESLSVKGEVSCLLRPLLDEFPIVGGITLFSLDPPKVDLHFGGLSHILESSLLARTVHRVINSTIANRMVLPNVLARTLGSEKQGVSRTLMKAPWPEGILKVKAVRAWGIKAHDWSILHVINCPSTGVRGTRCMTGLAKAFCCNPGGCVFKPTSDSYVHVLLGDASWRSGAVKGTLNPIWPLTEEPGYLPVFDTAQKVWIDLREGIRHRNALLGRARPWSVAEVLAKDPNFELLVPNTGATVGEGVVEAKGTLQMAFEWLEVTPRQEGNAGYVLGLRMENMRLSAPSKQAIPHNVAVRVKVGSTSKVSTFTKCRRDASGAMADVAVHSTLFLCLPSENLTNDCELVVNLEIVDHSLNTIASTSVSWTSLRCSKSFSYPQLSPDGGLGGISLSGEGVEVHLAAQISLAGIKAKGNGRSKARRSTLARQQAKVFSPHKPPKWVKDWLVPSSQGKSNRSRGSMVSTQDPESSLDWINACLAELWPRLGQALDKVARQRLIPMLAEKLPTLAAQGLSLRQFSLGSKPPRLRNLRLRGQRMSDSGNLEVLSDVSFDATDPLIELAFLGASMRLNKISFKGELHCRMAQLTEEAPVIGGLVFFFLDAPDIDIGCCDSNALEKVMHLWMTTRAVREAMNAALMKLMVLPHVLALPISHGVDVAELRKPPPLGVLRVLAFRLRNEGHDGRIEIFSGAVSVVLRFALGDVSWKTPTVRVNSNLVWKKPERNNFMVYDPEQKLTLDVCSDGIVQPAVLGSMEPRTIFHAVERQDANLPLYPPHVMEQLLAETAQMQDGQQQGNSNSTIDRDEAETWGEVTLKLQWLRLIPHKAAEDDWCAVSIRIHAVHLPVQLGHEAAVAVTVGQETWMSRYGEVRARSAVEADDGVQILHIDTIHYGFATKEDIAGGKVADFTLVGPKQRRLATASIPLKVVMDAPNMIHPPQSDPPLLVPFTAVSEGKRRGVLAPQVHLSVALLGLQPERGYIESDLGDLHSQ